MSKVVVSKAERSVTARQANKEGRGSREEEREGEKIEGEKRVPMVGE